VTSGLLALAREGLLLALALAAPLVIAALVASALTAIVGAVTQVRDPSLGMAPRVAAVALAVIAAAPFIAHQLVAFTARALALVAEVGRGTGT
jgi:flagellar biosynthesis protein FliQ